MTREIRLTVNDRPVTLDYFVQGFIDHTVAGMLAGLEGTPDMDSATLEVNGAAASITLNGAPVTVNAFVQKIIGSTVRGMVIPLKGVENPGKVHINIQRNA